MNSASDAGDRAPQVKYLVEDICEAFGEGVAVWDRRVARLVGGNEGSGEEVEGLRGVLMEGGRVVRRAYGVFYGRAGVHFAVGDEHVRSKLTSQLSALSTGIVGVLQQAHDDALAGIPCLPGSFHQYSIVSFARLCQKAVRITDECLSALKAWFSKISAWAVPLHTLPPAASQPTMPTFAEAEAEVGSLLEKMRFYAPFSRPRYEYEALPTPLSFRLVRVNEIVKRHVKYEMTVSCEIKTFHLKNPPAFQALSYCWGTGGQKSTILCDGCSFKVSQNLLKGLRRLCQGGVWAKSKWFWIDQICINQGDIAERTRQVRLMRAIYQRAMNTVIWLGPDDNFARDAFSLTNRIHQLSIVKRTDSDPLIHRTLTEERRTKLPPGDDKQWPLLSRFLDLEWFERCWIIQEVVVSPGDPVLLCGDYQMPWSRFQDAMAWLFKYDAGYRRERMKLVNGIFALSSTSEVWELQSLLHSTRPVKATNPRDKVFALLGLSGESRNPDDWPKALMPDYTRSVQDVYTEVTRYCIQRTGNLSILSQVDRSGDSGADADGEEYPSWVPRWDIQQSASSLSAYTVIKSAAGWKMLTEKYNSASRDFPVSQHHFATKNVLRLEGINVSTVDSCLPAMFPDNSRASSSTTSLAAHAHPSLLKAIPELFDMCRLRLSHLSPEALARTFFLVTTAGLTPEQTDARNESLSHFHAFLTPTSPKVPDSGSEGASPFSLHAALKSNLSISTLSPVVTPPSSSDDLGGSSFWEKQADPLRYTAALTPLLHRRLFITSEGHLGLGPAGMMSGDVIALLFGGRVPFVLRRVDGEGWRFVGECYVDGVMQGEVLGERGVEYGWFDLV